MAGLIYRLTFSLGFKFAGRRAGGAGREGAGFGQRFQRCTVSGVGDRFWVEEKRDPNIGFVVGGKNPTALLEKLTELNGRTIGQLDQVMHPVAAAEKGFLGPEERLLEVLAADNQFTSEQRLTRQQLARALRLLAAIGGKRQDEEFLSRGRRYRVVAILSRLSAIAFQGRHKGFM